MSDAGVGGDGGADDPTRLAGVAFDLDGTLIDSAPAIRRVGDRLLAEWGLAALSAEETRRFIGRGAPKFVARAFAARGVTEPEQVARAVARFEPIYAEGDPLENHPMPGAAAALARLAEAGRPLAICTNKPSAPTQSVLDALGWAAFFPVVIAGDSLAVKKPDPEPLWEARRRLGGGPIVFVGDSEVDAETAERAGVPFLLFEGGYRQAPVSALPHRASFAHFDALPALI